MSNRWAKRSEESEVRITTEVELLETLNSQYVPTGWSWTKAQELDQRLTTEMEFQGDVYNRYGLKPEPAAIKLFNQQVRRGQQITASQEQAMAEEMAMKAKAAERSAAPSLATPNQAIETNQAQEATNEERWDTKLSDEQCTELQTLWQTTVTDDSSWFAGQSRSLRQVNASNGDETMPTPVNNFHRGMVGSFGVRRKFGDAGANARLREAQAALMSENTDHTLCQYWQ